MLLQKHLGIPWTVHLPTSDPEPADQHAGVIWSLPEFSYGYTHAVHYLTLAVETLHGLTPFATSYKSMFVGSQSCSQWYANNYGMWIDTHICITVALLLCVCVSFHFWFICPLLSGRKIVNQTTNQPDYSPPLFRQTGGKLVSANWTISQQLIQLPTFHHAGIVGSLVAGWGG